MIYTQTIRQLREHIHTHDYVMLGAYYELVDGPINAGGYGVDGFQGVIEKAANQIRERYGCDAILVNAQFKPTSSNAHPSYGRRALLISGDLYRLKAVSDMPGMVGKPGKCVPNAVSLNELEYTQKIDVETKKPIWFARPPGCSTCSLRRYNVTEHEDGTISVTELIIHESDKGYLKRGVWT